MRQLCFLGARMSFHPAVRYCSFFVKTIRQNNKHFFTSASKYSLRHRTSLILKLESILHRKFSEMKITDEPNFRACLTEELLTLKNVFVENGHEIKIVGGAVRDLLMGKVPQDVDLATTATPDEMKQMFTQLNIRMINNNGERHGTITARINDRNFEVTTLRIDVITDGRRAEVQFTKNWFKDANRRDLTINAIFLDFDGTITDYFNGCEDLKNRTIRFVGDPAQRIQEDYLRIMRYFRFYGKIARDPDNHLEKTLIAIREKAEGLKYISGERIAVELFKIMNGNFVYEILSKMVKLKVGYYIGFPENPNLVELKEVTEIMEKNNVTLFPMTLLSALFQTIEELDKFYARIKPSNFDKNLGYFMIENREKAKSFKNIKCYQRYLLMNKNKQNSKEYIRELLKYIGNLKQLEEFENWKIPTCPVNGHILKSSGITGKNFSLVLTKLTDIWIESDYELNLEQLMEHLPKIVKDVKSGILKTMNTNEIIDIQ